MKKSLKKFFALTATTFTASATLVGPATAVLAQEEGETAEGIQEFETVVQNDAESIEGGTLHFALVGDPFAGVLNSMLYTGNPDSQIIGFFHDGLYGYNENFEIDNSGFADVEFNQEDSSVTFTIPQDAQWSDGEPITIDDVIFPYYVIGHPDYTGVRYGQAFTNVVGMEEYHNGDAEEIAGLNRVDDYTLTVSFIEFTPSMLQASGIPNYVEPEHILGEIPVAELEDADAVRSTPVGNGPFRLVSITPGEAITLEANEYYYLGRPMIDQVVIEVVNATSAVAEMRAGNYDLAALPADQYDTFADATNFQVLGELQNSITYIGFKLGTYDVENGTNVMDDSRVTNNKALRQAMAYAIDNDAVGSEFYSGLRTRANTHITPNFSDYHADDIEGYPYNPERAAEILAEAGFVDNDGDGFVEDPNGEAFTLGFASMSGGETAEPLAQYYLQSWQAIGINVELVDGQLMEFNSFYDRVEADDPAIDVFQAAFGTGGDPNPSGLYSRDSQFNYSRFVTEENDALIAAIESEDAFDPEVRQQAFHDWQAYMMEEIPTIPTLYRYNLMAVNNRVKGYDMAIGTDVKWTEIGLTAEQPATE
ncbi:oligopeptide ABC transporter substrate-binding protein [Fundicoccus culcitae]|uniref:Oligopeptide ABC transporter substrate-binding protein n=1 Tax=Fundicoccus culcitae TaxID=2969821 RepID=A0ABY5P690_9LACT|nr:oligopeptide ABC transporter substrate-binding protein [Fundicoccus culcitae]UUX34096.1 oligopeptide ABC transporter substrate-binding protein [Fundicoccus culcitae]